MSVHKYCLKGNKVKYFVKLYYKDYFGKLKPLVKRGFDTKRAAKDYERDYLARHKGNCSIPFSQICEDYLKDADINGLREGTLKYKRSIIKNLLIPFLEIEPLILLRNKISKTGKNIYTIIILSTTIVIFI